MLVPGASSNRPVIVLVGFKNGESAKRSSTVNIAIETLSASSTASAGTTKHRYAYDGHRAFAQTGRSTQRMPRSCSGPCVPWTGSAGARL